ncbi:hypothetical protein JXA31_04235 [Candidatus Bathyarchaeota archaeon]|nr:hypothetical protein [Candidatus Bathyarchaeota archaeon]
MEKTNDKVCWEARWRIDKFRDPTGEIARALQASLPIAEALQRYKDAFLGTEEWMQNVALNVGLQNLIEIICGIGTATLYNNANARLGVGSDATSATATQTDLLDASPTWKAMDVTYPQRSGQTAEWRATFGTGDANEAWNEYAVDNGATAHKLLNRKVESKGTKSSGETWTLSLQITFS